MGLIIALVTLLVYLTVIQNGFVNYEDGDYVTQNRIVQNGLAWTDFKWAFIGLCGTAVSNGANPISMGTGCARIGSFSRIDTEPSNWPTRQIF